MTRMDKGGDFAVRALLHPLQGHWLCAQEGASGQRCGWWQESIWATFGYKQGQFHFILRTELPISAQNSMVLKFKCFVAAAWRQGDWLRGQVCEVQIQVGGQNSNQVLTTHVCSFNGLFFLV